MKVLSTGRRGVAGHATARSMTDLPPGRFRRLPALAVLAATVLSPIAALSDVGSTSAPAAAAARFGVEYSTYLGGSADEELREIIVDHDGTLVLGGQTASADFPATEGAFQTAYGGEPPGTGHPGLYGGDSWVARLASDASRLEFATFFGGSKQERNVYGMELDGAGNIVLTTMTRSPDMPTSPDSFQAHYGGGLGDMVAAKLSPDGSTLLWCTYVGGSGDESPRGGLALDDAGRVTLVGGTDSGDFPTTAGAFQTDRRGERDAAVVTLSPDGSAMIAGTLLGGSASEGLMGVRIADDGTVHLGGHTSSGDFPASKGAAQETHGGLSDAYVAGLTGGLDRLLYATYLGGEGNEWAEHRLALLPSGAVLLTGVSASGAFPTSAGAVQEQLRGANDGFLAKVSSGDGAMVFSTLLGGTGTEFFLMPTVDGDGLIYLVGSTTSTDFPVTPDALQPAFGGGAGDGVVAVLSEDGSELLYATYFGGSGDELVRTIALAPDGGVLLGGRTSSPDFPTTSHAVQPALAGGMDGFVVKLAPSRPSRPTIWLPIASQRKGT